MAKKNYSASARDNIDQAMNRVSKFLALTIMPLMATIGLAACDALPGGADDADNYRPSNSRAEALVDISFATDGYTFSRSAVYQQEEKKYQVVSVFCLNNRLIKDSPSDPIKEQGLGPVLISEVTHNPEDLAIPWFISEEPRPISGPTVSDEEASNSEQLTAIKAAVQKIRPAVNERCQ